MNKSGFVLFSQNLVNGLASVFKSLISGRRGQLENEGVRACVCVCVFKLLGWDAEV